MSLSSKWQERKQQHVDDTVDNSVSRPDRTIETSPYDVTLELQQQGFSIKYVFLRFGTLNNVLHHVKSLGRVSGSVE